MKFPSFFTKAPSSPKNEELGVSGVKISTGYVYEEFLQELSGERGRRAYREMSDNDATIGAILYAVDSLIKAVSWRVETSPYDTTGEYAQFVDSLMGDMDHTWEDFISEVLTMLSFGFSLFEVVYKRRALDGKIGIKKLAPRAQETLEKWDMEDTGEIKGFWQMPPFGGQHIYIPMEKALLFRTTSRKNNPEGRSILRNAYTSYYLKKNIQFIESIAIERELNGLPVIRVPSFILTDPQHANTKAAYEKLARDIKFNDQGAVVIPSDYWTNTSDGKITTGRKVEIDLLSASGNRAIDTDRVITRYDRGIVLTVLADFLMLGNDGKGSFALSKSKTDLFLRSMKGLVNSCSEVLNRNLLPNIWRYNGFNDDMMPKFAPDEVAPPNLQEFGDYIRNISGAGFALAGDPQTEAVVRGAAGLPEEISELVQSHSQDDIINNNTTEVKN